ncbi:MAG: hypothetical protein QF415_06690 [Candidatus Undinarchaeales archaeon]|jgi:hypothetical protein|nr:hypothetical protein [Candidatus Undinarchaeales archaeon]MDP7492669.1 hypothetical protein [Candidatus Undinarchaeales archaeon]
MYGLDLETDGIATAEKTDAYHKTDDLSSYGMAGTAIAAGAIVGVFALAETAEAQEGWRDKSGSSNGSWRNYDVNGGGNNYQGGSDVGSNVGSGIDTDGDGLSDHAELNTYGTNPRLIDTDRDGINDGTEVKFYGSNPRDIDTDWDGLADGKEVYHGTNLKHWDSDGDGWSDGDEVHRGTNPRNFRSHPGPRYHHRWNGHRGHHSGVRIRIGLPQLNISIR